MDELNDDKIKKYKKGYGIIAGALKDIEKSETPVKWNEAKNDISRFIRKNHPFSDSGPVGKHENELMERIDRSGELRHSDTDYREIAKRLRTPKIRTNKGE